MAFIKCRGFFPENSATHFGFYGPKEQAQRRIRHEEEFLYEYDPENLPKIEAREIPFEMENNETGYEERHFIGTWIEVLEMPKKKPGPKPKEAVSGDK